MDTSVTGELIDMQQFCLIYSRVKSRSALVCRAALPYKDRRYVPVRTDDPPL